VPEIQGTEHTWLQPGRRWAGITGEQKGREGGRKTSAPVPVGQRRPAAQRFPLPSSLLLFSAAFLIPASSSGASGVNPIRSNLGEEAGSAPNLSQHPGCGSWVCSGLPRLLQDTGFWLLVPPIPLTPQNTASHPPLSPTALTRRASPSSC